MAGINPLFGGQLIKNIFDQFQKNLNHKIISTLQYLGEEFVNKARSVSTYKDRTGNLRVSIGYIVLAKGKVVAKNFVGKGKGKIAGTQIANEVAANYPNDYVLIGVAGMKYAAHVEAKGYDVITGSAPTKDIVNNLLNEL